MLRILHSSHHVILKTNKLANMACTVTLLILLIAMSASAKAQTFAQSCFTPTQNPPPTLSGAPPNPPAVTSYNFPSNYAYTQYPIVLLTGGLGSPNGGKNNTQYFYQIPQTLAYYGATVCVPELSGANTDGGPNGRGQELIHYLNGLRVELNNPTLKFNLIGHSQGGYTARVAAYVKPDLVASVTTIATPHKGSPITIPFAATNLIPSWVNLPAQTLQNYILASGIFAALYQGKELNAIGLLQQGSPSGTQQFNTTYPSAGLGNDTACTSGAAEEFVTDAVTGMAYQHFLYSWTGIAEQDTGLIHALTGLPIVNDTSISWLLDPALLNDSTTVATEAAGQVVLLLSPKIIFNGQLQRIPNDGVVDMCSAKYGNFLGAFRWSHLDEVNRERGVLGINAAQDDPVGTFLNHANRLKQTGL